MFPAYEIVAVLDDHPKAGKDAYRLGSRTFRVQQNAHTFWQMANRTYADGYDVFITSTKYQDEIKEQLMQEGDIPAASILSHDEIVDTYFQALFDGDAMRGRGVEIGGPTAMFQPIYERCRSCDNVNFAISMDIPMTYEYFVRRCLANFENRGMHQHVFSLELLEAIATYFHWEVLDCCRMAAGLMLKAHVGA